MKHLYILLSALCLSFISPKAFGTTVGPILGTPVVCAGNTTSLSDTTAGGTWSSSTPVVGTVGSSSGVVIGIVAGTTTITYTVPGGSYVTQVVTVNPSPSSISGTLGVCIGNTTTLTDAVPGGAWNNCCPLIATVTGTATGIVMGEAAGTCVITYTLPTGCYVTTVVTVMPIPSIISGSLSLYAGSYDTLTVSPSGGTWGGSGSIVTITPTSTGAVLYGIAAGTEVITYTSASGCTSTFSITVNPAMSSILGPASTCPGSTITLTDATTGGTWSSSNTTVATIASATGVVTAVALGTTTITYTLPASGYATTTISVVITPSAIAGVPHVCVGASIWLYDTTSGGTWSSSNTSIAAATGTPGRIIGIAPGTATISYTIGASCSSTIIVTVYATPSIISGSLSLYAGSYDTLTVSPSGGTWGGSGSIVTITPTSTGAVLYGIAAGTEVITYTSASGCTSTFSITVNPAMSSILGPASTCLGSTITLTDATTGGTWSSSNTTVASIASATGVVTAVALGTTTITYTLPTSGYATTTISVVITPSAIAGVPHVCVGASTWLYDTTSGGTWSSSNTSIAVASGTPGLVTGIAPGTATISYTIGAGCSATIVVTVNPLPGPISGLSSICVGSYDTLTTYPGGGTWSSGGGVVTITPISTGAVLHGVAAGSAVITYIAPTGCGTTFVITVNAAPPVPAISGTTFYCPCAAFVPFTITLVPGATALWYSSGSGGVGSTIPPTDNTCITGSNTFWASQALGGCESGRDSITVTVGTTPTITATPTANCGGRYSITGGGGSTYVWSPSSGLSCTACGTTIATITSSTTYTVTGTNAAGCTNTNTVTLNGNRISGFITMTTTPTDTLKVWLVQFNPIDSSLTAQDSVFTCMDGSTLITNLTASPQATIL